jgi:hydrogenase/urease accessory protein HupE
MTIKLYPDRIEIGSFTLSEIGSGIGFNGVAQADRFLKSGKQGRVAGFTYGGYVTNRITRFTLSTGSTATNVGYILGSGPGSPPATIRLSGGSSSETHGYAFGGNAAGGGSATSNIAKFPFAESSSSSVTASLAGYIHAAQGTPDHAASAESSYYMGPSPTTSGTSWYKFTYAIDLATVVLSNDMKAGTPSAITSVTNSMTHGYASGTYAGSVSAIKFPFANGNPTTQIGDMLYRRFAARGISSQTHGFVLGGASYTPDTPTPGYAPVNFCERYSFATDAPSVAVGTINVLPAPFGAIAGVPTSSYESLYHGYILGNQVPSGYAPYTLSRFPFNSFDVGSSVSPAGSAVDNFLNSTISHLQT